MNGYKLLVKVEELAKIVAIMQKSLEEIEKRLSVIEVRKVGRPPKKAEECDTPTTNF